MRILLCHNFYRYRGGEDVFVERLAALLESKGDAVHWLSANSRQLADQGLLKRLQSGLGALYSPETIRRVEEQIVSFQPDVAHVHNVFPQLSPSLYAALAHHNLPVVQHLHNFRFLCPNGLFYTHGETCQRCVGGNFMHAVRLRCLHGSLTQSAAYAASLAFHWKIGTFPHKLGTLIAANPSTAAYFRERLGEGIPIQVLEHFIDVPPRPQKKTAGRAVVYMGRLSQEKGVWTILDAAHQLADIPFHLIGAGPLEGALRQAARERHLDNVHIHGFIAGEGRFDFLRDALCVVVPSLVYEQFGIAVLEAYAWELPVIASNLGALAHIVRDGETGLLFPAGDVEALVASIRQLAANPSAVLVMGQQGRQLLEAAYTPETYYTRLMQIYREAMARSAG